MKSYRRVQANATAHNWRLPHLQPPRVHHHLHVNSNHRQPFQKSTQNSFSNTFTPFSHSSLSTTMLRRPPTTLTITAEDVAAYEDRRAGEALRAAQQAHAAAQAQAQQQQGNQGAASSSAMDGVQTSPSATRRTRDERIGVSRRR